MPADSSLFFFVNGRRVDGAQQDPRRRLAAFLRQELRLTGCKVACGRGVCGACTVLLSHCEDPPAPGDEPRVVHVAVNACQVPLAACHAKAVTTIEGLGSARDRLQPLQHALAEGHGVQCGFCSPGFVMSAYAALRAAKGDRLTPGQLEAALRGNLCRCTGYRPIAAALKTACCGGGCEGCPGAVEDSPPAPVAIDATQELLFPPELLLTASRGGGWRLSGVAGPVWVEAASRGGAVAVLKSCPGCVIVGGNTMAALNATESTDTVLSLACLSHFSHGAGQLRIGCGMTLEGLERRLAAASLPQAVARELLALLREHQSAQVKAMATVGGSLAAFRTYPFLLTMAVAVGASLAVWDRETGEERQLDAGGFAEAPGDDRFVLFELSLPLQATQVRLFHLRQPPIRTALAAADDRLVAALPQEGRQGAYRLARLAAPGDEALTADPYAHSLLRAWSEAARSGYEVPEAAVTGAGGGGTQSFDVAALTASGPIGRPMMTSFALEAASGEAEFIDDVTPVQDEVEVALVRSSQPHARLLEVDPAPALAMPGVLAFLGAKDVPHNEVLVSLPPPDEEVFASELVHFVGQPIGAIVAESRDAALAAAEAVLVRYEPLPAVLGIEAALAASSFLRSAFCASHENRLARGEAPAPAPDLSVTGQVALEAQEHFYMEPHCALALPGKEASELTLLASSHSPSDVQRAVATMLGLAMNRVEVRVRRLGGSFGGKEVRGVLTALPAALAAWRLRRPARCVLPRRVDMELSGHSHPLLARYGVQLATDRRSLASLSLDLSLDGGFSTDVSTLVRAHALAKAALSYRLPHVALVARAVRTNRASNTAFRGFGGPQAFLAVEMALEHAAESLGVCPDELRAANLVAKGEENAMLQRHEDDNLRRCWDECWRRADYAARRGAIRDFNARHDAVKKGLAMVPVSFWIGYDAAFLNQASVALHVYHVDGSLLLAHAGVEMGQGLDVKMRQVVAQAFGLPLSLVHTRPVSTAATPNMAPTGSSCGADLVGNAVLDACAQLKERLKWAPKEEEAEQERLGRWKGAVAGAFFGKVDLSAHGFFAHPCPGNTPEAGGPAFYRTYGAGCSEVELTVATGEYRLVRADLVMDVGRSLNPAVDIGQIEGGFMQGFGRYCRERLDFGTAAADRLPERVVEDYSVPRMSDVADQMNVHLLTDTENAAPHAVYSSKGTGEPPMLLGCSAYLALRRAIRAAGKEGKGHVPRLDCPATSDRVRAAIEELQGRV